MMPAKYATPDSAAAQRRIRPVMDAFQRPQLVAPAVVGVKLYVGIVLRGVRPAVDVQHPGVRTGSSARIWAAKGSRPERGRLPGCFNLYLYASY